MPLPLTARFNGGPTVADLAERYLEEHAAVRIKPKTQLRVRGMLNNHILPALGRLPIETVEPSQVVEFHQKLSDRPVTANKCVKVLSHMYRLGEGWGLVPEGFNPCRSVEKYPERSRERFLTDAEFARLGRVLDEAVNSGTVPLTRRDRDPPVDADRLPQERDPDPELVGRRFRRPRAPSRRHQDRPPCGAAASDGGRAIGSASATVGQPLGVSGATTGTGATAAAASTMPGGPCGPRPGLRTSGCMTSDTASHPVRWRSARPCR